MQSLACNARRLTTALKKRKTKIKVNETAFNIS